MKQNHWLTFTLLIVLTIVISFAAFEASTSITAQSGSDCQLTLSPWTTAASAPFNHIEGATAVVNNKLYLIGGFKDSDLNTSGRVDVYNPQTNVWESVAKPRQALPVNLSHAQAAVDGNSIWLAGGFLNKNPGPATNKVYRYDTVQDKWYTGPNLPAARAGGGMALVGRELHYFGGTASDHDTSYSNHWYLNLDNTGAGWKNAPDFPNKRIHSAGAVVAGKLYAIGGQTRHDHDPVDLKWVHVFNPSTNQWAQKASLSMPRSHFEPGTLVYNGRIIIVGGRANQSGSGNGQLKQVTQYNPATNTWSELRELPVKLIAPNAAVINNKLIVTAGGTNWNTAQKKTYVSTISMTNCNGDSEDPPPTPTPVPGGTTTGVHSVYISVDSPNTDDIIKSSTYSSASFVVTNNSQDGKKIKQIKFDMRPAILQDLAFDPNGTAGDVVGKGFTANNGTGATGYASASYQFAFDGGYAGLTANFNDFGPGETFKFSIDIDPTSIQGTSQPGPSESGNISGLEMVGTLVTVVFTDNTTLTGTLYRKGTTNDGSELTLKSGLPAAPSISIGGATTPKTVSSASQTVKVTGTAGASVKLLLLEAALYVPSNGGHNVSTYESNTAVKVKEFTATIGSNGTVNIPVTLTRTNSKAGYNHLMAVITNANGMSSTSNRLVLKYVPASASALALPADEASRRSTGDSELTGSTTDPQLIAPGNQSRASADLQFVWQDTPGATAYRLVIKRADKDKVVADFKFNAASDPALTAICNGETCTFTPAAFNLRLKPGRSYTWRIVTTTDAGKQRSARAAFDVEEAASALIPLP